MPIIYESQDVSSHTHQIIASYSNDTTNHEYNFMDHRIYTVKELLNAHAIWISFYCAASSQRTPE